MSMTIDPATKDEKYLARFYRDERLIHVQRDTLNNIAVLCGSSLCRVDLVRGDRVIGSMSSDGLVDWFEEWEGRPSAGLRVTVPVQTEFGGRKFVIEGRLTGRIDRDRRHPDGTLRDGFYTAEERTPWVEVLCPAVAGTGRAPSGEVYLPAYSVFAPSGDDLLTVLDEYAWDDGHRVRVGEG